jgi:hypothetical protein
MRVQAVIIMALLLAAVLLFMQQDQLRQAGFTLAVMTAAGVYLVVTTDSLPERVLEIGLLAAAAVPMSRHLQTAARVTTFRYVPNTNQKQGDISEDIPLTKMRSTARRYGENLLEGWSVEVKPWSELTDQYEDRPVLKGLIAARKCCEIVFHGPLRTKVAVLVESGPVASSLPLLTKWRDDPQEGGVTTLLTLAEITGRMNLPLMASLLALTFRIVLESGAEYAYIFASPKDARLYKAAGLWQTRSGMENRREPALLFMSVRSSVMDDEEM